MPNPEVLLAELREAGASDEAISLWLDGAFAFDVIFPGPAGELIEAHDDAIFKASLKAGRQAVKRLHDWLKTPDRKKPLQEWLAKRKAKRAARKAGQ